MKKNLVPLLVILGITATISSCTKESNSEPSVKAYTVPATYTFTNVSYVKSTQRAKMTVELDSYLRTANSGAALIALDQNKVNNMWNNTGSPFADATLSTSGINIKDVTADPALFKSFADSMVLLNNGTAAVQGKGGALPRGANKIIISAKGLELEQGFLKGMMGGLIFKEAVRILTAVKAMPAADTTAAQTAWDEAFGYLTVPANYDSSVAYLSSDPNAPLLWGGYLRERGRPIQAGGTIFNAFLKGRAAIGGYDISVRNEQADIIMNKWEQLAARAALVYATMPTSSSSVGNLGSQFHALSEGFGFILSLKYRSKSSKLTSANYETLYNIFNKDYYVLVNQTGFTDLLTAQNILKITYNILPD